DQDAPSPSNSPTTQETQTPILSHDVEEDNHDIEVAHMGNDPYFGIPIPEVTSDQSSSSDVIHTIVPPDHQVSEHNSKWTKDHPLENIIGALDRPVSTRLQLHEQALFCYYDAFLTSVEPKNYKEALTQACWIEAMQEELHEFERLEVWELVPPPDKAFVISLKWIYKKALYGLKQAPRAWYDMLSSFLISNDFSKGSVDPTLFIRREGNELILVQIYVDDIIFAASTPELCDLFAKIMCSKFKMSMMGKISFFLGLQISQSPRGIFINQSKYALESLKKYGYESCDPVDTPMVEKSKLDEDKEGKAVDPSHYRGMIGTLLYLTASRPDLQFAICMCARYQARPTEKHLNAEKDLSVSKRNRTSGSMVSEGFSFALTAFADAIMLVVKIHAILHLAENNFCNAEECLDRERSNRHLLERKKVNEELRNVRWWEIVRRRPTAASKDHMIYHMLFSSYKNIRVKLRSILTDLKGKVRIVERARAKNERPIITVAKHHTVTLLATSVVRPSGELSASTEREFIGDASVGDGGYQGVASVGGQDNAEPIVAITDNVETETPGPKRTKKKRVIRGSERTPAASHPPKRLRADYGTTGGSATGGKSPSVLNRLLQDSRLMVEQGVPALPTLPFITSSVTASPLEEGGDHTDSVTGPSLRTVGPSARFVVLSDSSHHSGAKSADPEVDSLVRSAVPVMTEATTVTTIATTVAIPADVGKDKSVPHPSVFGSSSSSEKTDRTLSLFTGRSGSGFAAGSIRAEEVTDASLEEIYVPEWTMRMLICKRRWKSLTEEKDNLLQVKDKEIKDLRSQLLQAKVESMEVTSLESIIAEKDRKLSDLEASSSFLRSQNQSLVNQVNELETSSTDLRGKLEMYEGSMKQLEEFQDNLMKPFEARLAEIDADFTRCCMHFQENFHPHLLNAIAGRRWLLTHGMKLLMAKCLNSTEYMEALGNAFGRAIEKGMQEGLAAGIKHGQAGRCLSDLEAYNPSAEADFNSAVRDLRGLDFPLLQELFAKKDASTWDVMDLLRLDEAMAEVLGMTDLQPDVGQLMVPVHYKQDKVVIGSQALSVALETCHHHPIFIEALAILPETSTEPLVTTLVTTALSTMVIRPNPDPFLLNEARDAVL
ncbi:retrovirus-related pol polyprotein from transposon TNT 1-94, partial [Tanacetum coccineum]